MDEKLKETLEIKNFLSISYIKWEIAQFNIITGDMGAGKSICIKLLKFFEDIIRDLLVLPYEDFLVNLVADNFYSKLTNEFMEIFDFLTLKSNMQPEFKIIYTFSYNSEEFEVIISGKGETDISIKSLHLEKILNEWLEYFQKKEEPNSVITPDGFAEAKMYLYTELRKKFDGYFPMVTTFVPASRAALAFGSSHIDNYLKKYKELIDVIPRYKSRNHELTKKILKADVKIEDRLYLVSDDGRKVPIAKASSGQQEIVYVLLLLDKLGNFSYYYGTHQSLFIEEPEAHLFPLEQKQTIELIVHMFNILKGNGNSVRFFITTHSPYILDSLNNSLKKGNLLNTYKGKEEKINDAIDIPHLNADEVSAYSISINGNGESMMDDEKEYLHSNKISEISNVINIVTSKLRQLDNELYYEKD